MIKEKLVSVIIPIYKVEKYLTRCLDTVINQTYRNLEIILVDDGSPDKCPEICDEYATKDGRIKVLHKKNGGVSAARNSGIRIATGDFFVFVDSDDFLNLNAIQRWILLSEKYNADMVIGNFKNYYGKEAVEDIIKISSDNETTMQLNSEQALYDMFIKKHELCAVWGKMYSKSIIDRYEFKEDSFFGEDMYASGYYFDKSKIIIMDDFVGTYYSQEGVSLVRSSFNLKKMEMLSAADEWVDLTRKKYPKLINAALYRRTVILTNLCGDVTFWEAPEARKLFAELSMKLIDSWSIIKNNEYFRIIDWIKCYIVKNNWFYMMRVYKKIRMILSKREIHWCK